MLEAPWGYILAPYDHLEHSQMCLVDHSPDTGWMKRSKEQSEICSTRTRRVPLQACQQNPEIHSQNSASTGPSR
jgi:hypothetical protein